MGRTVAAVGVGTRRRTLALAVPLAGLTAGLFLPPVLVGLPLAGQRALIVTLITILLWTGELLEPGVAALVGVTLLALSGATRSLRDALQGLRQPRALLPDRRADDGRRRSAQRAGRTSRPDDPGARTGAEPGGLSPAGPFVPRVHVPAALRDDALRDPHHIYDEVFTLGGVQRGAEVAKAIMLALASINRLASTTLLTGGITPVMSAAIIGGMSSTGWFTLMAVPYYAILLLGGVLTYALYRRGFTEGLPTPEPARRRPISGTEWRTLAVILSASALWLTDGAHHLDAALPALLAFAALLTPGVGPLVWTDLERGVGWSNFFVIAASISLAHALGTSGSAPWLGRLLVGGLPGLSRSALAVVVLLMLGATLLRVVVPNISGFLALAL